MKKFYLPICFVLCTLAAPVAAQIHLEGYRQADIAPQWLDGRWTAQWISVPGEPQNAYGIYHFRKTFELPEQPERFVVHVSADNRYKLYVNGELASVGPARGDVFNWNFETVDLARWQKYAGSRRMELRGNETGRPGQFQPDRVDRTGQHSGRRGRQYERQLAVQPQRLLQTAPGARLRLLCRRTGRAGRRGRLPLGLGNARIRRLGMEQSAGRHDRRSQRSARLSGTPMENRTERFAEVRRSDGVRIPEGFPGRAATVTVPAHTTAEILLDNDSLTTAYLSLLFSGGKGSQITVAYAEALYRDTQTFFKDDRNEVKNKQFLGYEDIVRPDGGNGRLYTTLWWRTWRYVKLTVTTQDEPLELQDIYGTFTAYPFERASSFAAPGHEKLSRMLDIGWRTARLCANETYMDCPYYEQLQYFGDTRIQAMISLYNTRDPYMVRNALEQGRQSIVADGITMSRYPSGLHQFISSFSLYWICTGYDYWRYRGDEEYLKTLLPAFRGVLSWYEGFLREDHSLGYIPHWFFADWASNFDGGEPIRKFGVPGSAVRHGARCNGRNGTGFRHPDVRGAVP